jgi:hypothetical protein
MAHAKVIMTAKKEDIIIMIARKVLKNFTQIDKSVGNPGSVDALKEKPLCKRDVAVSDAQLLI